MCDAKTIIIVEKVFFGMRHHLRTKKKRKCRQYVTRDTDFEESMPDQNVMDKRKKIWNKHTDK